MSHASAPEFRLYNTMTRTVEPFAPADGVTVRMYACGPTVYNPAHLGNFRTFLFGDLMRRAFQLRGWRVDQVMNLTDVDDKIINKARANGVRIGDVTEEFTRVFHEDRKFLRIQDAEHYPPATRYIGQMIALVQRLIDNGIAYQAEDGSVYFAIDRFPEYGRLSHLDTRELKTGARVAQDDYTKENAQDFALWKAAKEEDEAVGAAWDSPWGRGRPGWHLECSAMSMDILGETLDVHTGGVDLIFPHHEDEIAQSEAATGKTFARMWCHGEFLLTDGSKMAKRVGNVRSIAEMREQKISPAAVRHVMFSTHYRQQLNLSADALDAAATAVKRLGTFGERLAAAAGGTPELAQAAATLEADARAALFDDLNAPEALAALHTFVSRANAELDRRGSDTAALERARAAFAVVNGVLDVLPDPPKVISANAAGRIEFGGSATATAGAALVRSDADSLAAAEPDRAESDAYDRWIGEAIAARISLRGQRDFVGADAIRAMLKERGVILEDGPGGTKAIWS